MRILHLVHRYYPAVGGAEKYFQEISERFARERHDVSVYTSNAKDLEYFFSPAIGKPVDAPAEEEIHNVHVRRFSNIHFPLRNQVLRVLSFLPFWQTKCLFQPYQMFSMRLLLKSRTAHQFDIVNATASPFTFLLYVGYLYARANNAPFVITPFVHIGEEKSSNTANVHATWYQVKLWKKADAIIVQTTTEKKFIASCGIPEDRIYIVGAGIDPDSLGKGDGKRFRTKYAIAPEEKIIAHIARWDTEKGTVQLIEAFKKLLDRQSNVRLVLLGSATIAFNDVWSKTSDAIKNHTLILEHADDETKRDLLDAMDVFVMPSRVESFGIVYLESWFYKKPVIGADIPAMREIIQDSKNGYLVRFGHVEELSAKLMNLFDNPDIARKMGEAGHTNTINNYTWDKKYAHVRSIYEKLLRRE